MVALTEQVVMRYAPLLLVGGFSAHLALTICIVYCCWGCKNPTVQRERWHNLLLMVAFLFFSIICGVDLAARTYTALYGTYDYKLWMVYAVMLLWRDLVLLFAYSLYLYLPTQKQNEVEDERNNGSEKYDQRGLA